jgi:NAD(P)-dependent dehydrogenase (short-subunit alcohol dehydrogenase family)
LLGQPVMDEGIAYYQADVTNRADLEQTLRQITERWGTPSILVNNAALDSPPDAPPEENGPFETYPESSWDNVMSVNVKGVFVCCQVFGGAMASAEGGSIINISSIYGLVSPDQRIYRFKSKDGGPPFFKPVAYSASKSALFNLTRYLAAYWAEQNVRVNTLTLAGVWNNQPTEFLEGYTRKVPLGRMANPDEYNGAIVFLASPASSYMTGSNLVIDGGFTSW